MRSPISGRRHGSQLRVRRPVRPAADPAHHADRPAEKVIANISEQYFPNVKVGMPVKLAVDIFPDEEFTGTVSLIYPALDPTTRTFKVEVKVPNAKRTLRPGMYARTTLDMGSKGRRDGSRRGRAKADPARPSVTSTSSSATRLPSAARSRWDARSATAWTSSRGSKRASRWPSRRCRNFSTGPKWILKKTKTAPFQ